MSKWDLSYFYKTEEDFESELASLSDYIPRLESFKGSFSNPEKYREYLLISEELETKLYRVYQYAHLRSDLNKKDTSAAMSVG